MSSSWAVVVILASATMYGLVSIAVRALLVSGVSVEATVLGRFAISAIALLLVPRLFGVQSAASNRTRLLLLLLGAIFLGVQAMILFSALRMNATAPVVFLFFTFPCWVAIMSAAGRIERMTILGVTSLIVVCAGAYLVISPGSPMGVSLFGAVLALASAAMYALFIVVTPQLLQSVGRVEGAGWVAAGATLTSAAATVLAAGDNVLPGPTQLMLLGGAGILGTAALLGYFYGLERAGGNTVALFGMWEPVVVAFLAATLLHEALTPIQLVGGAVVLAGLGLRVFGQTSLRRVEPVTVRLASPSKEEVARGALR